MKNLMNFKLYIASLTFILLFILYLLNSIVPIIILFTAIIIIFFAVIIIYIKNNKLKFTLPKNIKQNKLSIKNEQQTNKNMPFFDFLIRNLTLFILKLLIFGLSIFIFLILVINYIDNSIAKLNKFDKPILEKVYEEIVDAADPKHEIDPNKQQKLKESLSILSNRAKPFIAEIKKAWEDDEEIK